MYVIVYATMTIDGRIGYGQRLRLSSDRDLHRLHILRSSVDAVMVGANTVISDNPLLTVRLPGYKGKQPYRIVIDMKLKTDPNYRVFDTSISKSFLITSYENINNPLIKNFISAGVEVVFTKKINETMLDLREAFSILENRYGVRKILVEGGGFLIGSLIKQRLVNELNISISPKILGKRGVPLVNIDLGELVCLEPIDVYIDTETGEILLKYMFCPS